MAWNHFFPRFLSNFLRILFDLSGFPFLKEFIIVSNSSSSHSANIEFYDGKKTFIYLFPVFWLGEFFPPASRSGDRFWPKYSPLLPTKIVSPTQVLHWLHSVFVQKSKWLICHWTGIHLCFPSLYGLLGFFLLHPTATNATRSCVTSF